MNKIEEVDDKSRTITTQAGVILETLINAAAEKNLLLENLYKNIEDIINSNNSTYKFSLNHKNSYLISFIYENSTVLKREDDYDEIVLKISCNKEEYNKINNKLNQS